MNENQENNSPELPSNPDVKIADGTSIEDCKTSIKVIEGLFHAVNRASFPLVCYGDVMNGMTFLKAIHNSLISQIGPDEVAKIRAEETKKAAMPPSEGMVQ